MKPGLLLIAQAIGLLAPLYTDFDAHSLYCVPFKYATGHIITVPVKVCGEDCTFVLDTGCGVNVISDKLIKKYACKYLAKHTGQRMSGQELSMDMYSLPSMEMGACVRTNVAVASWDIQKLLGDAPELKDVQGFVSLDFFKNCSFTMDYGRQVIVVENPVSLRQREASGTTVPIQIKERRGFETSISMPVSFSDGSKAKVEVDTGSGRLILDTRYMKIFAIDPAEKNVRTVKGIDETSHSYVRYFTQLPLVMFAADSDRLLQNQPDVEFQKIIYDGLVGDSFLRNFTVTYDLPGKRLILKSQ